jgi:hypothetical protein
MPVASPSPTLVVFEVLYLTELSTGRYFPCPLTTVFSKSVATCLPPPLGLGG